MFRDEVGYAALVALVLGLGLLALRPAERSSVRNHLVVLVPPCSAEGATR